MKLPVYTITLLVFFSFLAACTDKSVAYKADISAETQKEEITEMKLQTLMKQTLALAENVEVVVSQVEIPRNITLPLHFHPGEEFAYIIEGSGTISMEGEEDIIVKGGDIGMIPFKHHHQFTASEEGTKMVVFRVHEKGQPERTLVTE